MAASLRLAATLATAIVATAVPLHSALAPVQAADAAVDETAARPEVRAPAIRVVPLERRELVETLTVNGTIVPRQEAAVGFDLSGLLVEELFADEGDTVKKGDLLARLDRSTMDVSMLQIDASRAQAEAAVGQARAQIGDAEVGVRQAREGLERARALQEKGVAAKATLDNAVNAVDSAEARLNSARKAVESSEAQIAVIEAQRAEVAWRIGRTEVRAPAGGLILSRSATLGGIVSASGGALFRMAVDGEFELAAKVAERELGRIATGMPVRVALAGAGGPVDGRVRLISPEIDPASRLATIRVTLPRDAGARAGNFAHGEVEVLRREGVAAPASALVYRGRDAFLQLVENETVKTVAVETGARADGYVEIVSGAGEGAEIVSRAGTFVADGDRVTPVRGEQTGAVRQ